MLLMAIVVLLYWIQTEILLKELLLIGHGCSKKSPRQIQKQYRMLKSYTVVLVTGLIRMQPKSERAQT